MSQFFISGVQRSGTTLLAVMLSNHREILMERRAMAFQIISTFRSMYDILPFNMDVAQSDFLQWLTESDSNSRLSELLDINLLNKSTSISKWIEQSIDQKLLQNNKTVWGDKSPNLEHYYNDVQMIMPNAKMIHIVRDGRSVAYSMNSRASTHLLLSAQRWVEGNSRALINQQIVGEDRYLIIKYEDLLTAPDKSLRKVCLFIGIDFDERILQATDEQITEGQNYVKQQLDKSKIDKWKEQLTSTEIRKIEEIQGPGLRKLGYRLETPSTELKHRPLTTFRFIMFKQRDNIKSLFVPTRIGMVDRENVEIKISLKIRLYSFLKNVAHDLVSVRIFKSLFPRDFYKEKYYRK